MQHGPHLALLRRTTRRLELTEEGAAFLAQARRILERLRELSAAFGTVIEIETVRVGEQQSSLGRVVIDS